MSERVRVVRHEGRLLAAKDCGSGDEGLRVEADLLARCQVPGVVELVGTSGGERPTLLTVWAGPRSLADLPRPLDPSAAAALCVAVAATVTRLHRVGVVHGAIDPTHVLLDADGRPVLCGFGRGGPIGALARRPTTESGPASTAGSEAPETLRPALDVAGLGHLLENLLGPDAADPRGPARRRLGGRRIAATRRALLTVAAQATVAEPTARPSVAAFARAVRRAAPDATLAPSGDRPETPAAAPDAGRSVPPRPSRSGRAATPVGPQAEPSPRWSVTVGLFLFAVVAVAATAWFGVRAWSAPSPSRSVTAMTPTAPSARATASTTTMVEPPTTATPPSTTTTAGTPPSPPPTPAGDPVVVEHDGRRYAVGAPGDVVAVGPWLCDGRNLAVVLRPGDGTVHLFDAWPDAGATSSSRTVATVPGAVALATVTDGAGCSALLVSDDDTVLATLTAPDLS